MAITQVQKAAAVSNAVTFGGNTTAGNLLVAMIQASSDVTGVSDGTNGAWTKAVDYDDGPNALFTEIWYFENCAGGVAPTVTAANGFGSGFAHIAVAEYSGCATASALDKTAAAHIMAGETITAGPTATTAQADELLVGVSGNLGAGTFTWTQPANEQYDDNTGGASRAMSWADEVVAATGTYSASGTFSAGSAASAQAVLATFKAAAGGSTRKKVHCGVTVMKMRGGAAMKR